MRQCACLEPIVFVSDSDPPISVAPAQTKPISLDANPSDPKPEAIQAQFDKVGQACCFSGGVADPLETCAELVVTLAVADG